MGPGIQTPRSHLVRKNKSTKGRNVFQHKRILLRLHSPTRTSSFSCSYSDSANHCKLQKSIGMDQNDTNRGLVTGILAHHIDGVAIIPPPHLQPTPLPPNSTTPAYCSAVPRPFDSAPFRTNGPAITAGWWVPIPFKRKFFSGFLVGSALVEYQNTMVYHLLNPDCK